MSITAFFEKQARQAGSHRTNKTALAGFAMLLIAVMSAAGSRSSHDFRLWWLAGGFLGALGISRSVQSGVLRRVCGVLALALSLLLIFALYRMAAGR